VYADPGDGAVRDRERHDRDRPPARRDKNAREAVDEHRMGQRAPARAHPRPGRDLARATRDNGPLGAARPHLDLGGEHTDAERAALELTEQATRIADAVGGVTDEAWANAARYYDTDQLAALVTTIVVINAYNRFNVMLKNQGGDYQPGQWA
jgi:alkylhydroperoxidase family enzyme